MVLCSAIHITTKFVMRAGPLLVAYFYLQDASLSCDASWLREGSCTQCKVLIRRNGYIQSTPRLPNLHSFGRGNLSTRVNR